VPYDRHVSTSTLPGGPEPSPSSLTPNALARAFGLLGDEWNLFLLRYALNGMTRYSEFSSQLPISHAVLTARLERLVEGGLMERREYQQHPPRSEYVLTPAGRATWPILVAIWTWERRWVSEHSYETPPIHHTRCGNEISPIMTCASCHQQIQLQDLTTVWGPSGGWRRSVPQATTRRRSPKRGNAITHTFYPDTMAVYGNRWSAGVVGAAFIGVKRFTDFEAAMGVPPSLLAERLSALCEHDVLAQTSQADRSDWSEYRLTSKGRDFYPVIALTIDWADHWLSEGEGPVFDAVHVPCGSTFHGRLTCDHCNVELAGPDVKLADPSI